MLRWVLLVLGVIVALPVLAVGGLWLALQQGWLNDLIEERASAASGYQVELGAAPELDWQDGALRLALGPLRIADPEGRELATVERASAELALRPLLNLDVVIPSVAVEGVDAVVERDAQGRLNWQLPDREAAAGDGPLVLPDIRGLQVTDVQIDYRDPGREVSLVLDELEGQWAEGEPLTLAGTGRLGDEALTITGSGPSRSAMLSGSGEPLQATLEAASTSLEASMQPATGAFDLDLEAGEDFAAFLSTLGLTVPTLPAFGLELEGRLDGEGALVDARITVAETVLHFDGRIDRFGADADIQGSFAAAGPNPGPVLASFGFAKIDTPPYDLKGELTRDGRVLTFDNVTGTIGDSEIAGSLQIDDGEVPISVRADLESPSLDLDDLLPLLGMPPQSGPGETASPAQAQAAAEVDQRPTFLPAVEIDPARWQNLDLDVQLTAAEVRSDLLPIDRLDLNLSIQGGWLTIDPLDTGLADGGLVLYFSFDTTQRPPYAEVDLRLDNLTLRDILAKLGQANEAAGLVDGRIRLEGWGLSLAELLGSSNGRAGLVMSEGSLDALIVEAIGLDLMEGLILFATDDTEEQVPIRCAVVNLEVEDGVATTHPILVDTADSVLTAVGSIDLGNETLDLLVESHPKDASLLSGNQPLQVEGDWRSPTVAPAPGDIEDNTLGWLLAPIAALVPFFDLGLAEDAPCGQLLADAKKAAAEAPDE